MGLANRTTRGAAAVALAAAVSTGCGTLDAPSGGAPLSAPPKGSTVITALGRIEPKDGIIRISGPSRPTVVIAKLLVEKGDRVDAGQPIAVLDTLAENQARVTRAKAELTNALADLGRVDELFKKGIAAPSLREENQMKVDVARAELQGAQSALDMDTVRAPMHGQVIEIHARQGERVGPSGIAEIAQTDRMYAVAEVYETDIARVKPGQHATIGSRALDPSLTGTVDRVGMKIGKLDVLDTDPAARTDARVVEVEIQLDDSTRAAALSNLQVEVAIAAD